MDWFVKVVSIVIFWFLLSALMTMFQGRRSARVINLPIALLIIVITFEHAGPALARVNGHYEEVQQDVRGLTDALNVVGNTRNKVNDSIENVENSPIINFGSKAKLPGRTFSEIFSGGHLEWPLKSKEITQKFSPPDHHGIDFAVEAGTPILAAREGRIREAGVDSSGIYGNYILIDHGGGFQTLYAHCSELKTQRGKNVFDKDVIALSGNTGNSTGPHLHFEVRYSGKAVDPMQYLRK
ncbi:M23 family metallopeptidase [Desulfosporosinus fructosivorans]|uniref:M23 family metallopeptidase n=1 Tax=Desulfosporosinus fructosivorans TaxID=2018669 RepID=A0A4Z0QZ99_9FIRM|nr:M23 family metallopeptidase [Desulfosporosinus fructosivorans]TGE35848.1 M23 family metallopeptidase [Desulfosporosinus fructosivorans]